MAMFERAEHVNIYGGSFAASTGSSSKGGLDKLVAEVAPNAILNAGGRAEEVRCFPGTREELIGKLEKFMDDESPGRKRMMWLSGPAGSGKSAIFQTVAERRNEQGRQAANFFFFRGDSTRSHSKPLVATLVYQLRRFYPALSELLATCLETDPLICSASIEEQFKQLISFPIQTIQRRTPIRQQIVIIIDGLDECNDERVQDQILVALHTLAHGDGSPFLILVSSRAEPQLVMSFNRLGSSVESIFLNDDYQPEKDIRHFVVAKFAEIRRDHHLARTLSAMWPTEADIDAIVKKSSGQFIYAVTVMRYIQFLSSSPALSLVTILEMRASADHNPLAHLDAVYSHIFSKAHHIRAVRLILYARYCTVSCGIAEEFVDTLQLAGYNEVKVESFFADLVAIIKFVPGVRGDPLQFYHASLEDYLTKKSRSTIYYVNDNEIAAELSSMCLGNICDAYSIEVAVIPLSFVQKPTPQLCKSLLDASTKYLGGETQVLYLDNLIAEIERLYWEHDQEQFKILLQNWNRFVYINNLDELTCTGVRAQNPLASQYYKQYWITGTERYGGQEPLTPPGSAPVSVARSLSNTEVSPVTASPSASIGNPVRNVSIQTPEAPPGNNSCSDDGRGGGTALQHGTLMGSARLHPFRSVFHERSDPLGRKVTRRLLRSTSVHKEEEEGSGSREYDGGSDKLSMIRVKIHYQDNIRSMTLSPNTPFSEFVNKITTKFGKNFDNLTIKFKDDDGDKITLGDDSDYEHAIDTARQSSKGKATGKLEIWCQDSV